MERIREMLLVGEPYPIPDGRRNRGDAEVLLVPYAGAGGELSSYLQCLHASLVLASASPRTVAAVFACVAEAEQIHLRILGEAIVSLGGLPSFARQGRGEDALAPLSRRTDRTALLLAAAEAKRLSIRRYRRLLGLLRSEFPKALVSRILIDEEKHLELFLRLIEEIGAAHFFS